MRSIRNQAGLSIVEVMIASLLGLFITLGLTQLFVGSSDNFRLAESVSRIQESGRLAHGILGQAVRNADYWGCVKHSGVENILDASNEEYDEEFHSFDLDAGGSVDVTVAAAGDEAVAGSHIIRLKGADGLGIRLDGEMNNASAVLDVTTSAGLEVDDILLLSDCSNGAVFQATGLPGSGDKVQHNTGETATGPGNASGDCPPGGPASANCFPKAFSSGDVLRPYVHQYEVRISATTNVPALFLVDDDGAEELIDGVVDMRVEVGEGAGMTVTQWNDAGTAGINMDNAKALRISLLVRSPDDGIASSAQSVCFPAWADCSAGPNWTAPAGDLHLYRVYTSTYSIRNRLLEPPGGI